MKTTAKLNDRSRPSARLVTIIISLVFLAIPATGFAQRGISKGGLAKRDRDFKNAIAAMEAEEARQKAEAARLAAAQEEHVELDAGMEQSLAAGAALVVEDPLIAKARAESAARDARILREASAEELVVLAPQQPAENGVPVEGNGPAPGPKPVPQSEIDKAKKKKDGKAREVVIVATGGSTFNSNANLVVFEGGVVVNHPEFDLSCDKLIIFMKKSGAKDAEGAGDSSIDKAIATGKKVLVRKRTETGDIQIGQARKVTFDGKTGDVILQDSPQVQRGSNLIMAKEPGTIITLKQDGQMKTNGPTYAQINQPEKDADIPTSDNP